MRLARRSPPNRRLSAARRLQRPPSCRPPPRRRIQAAARRPCCCLLRPPRRRLARSRSLPAAMPRGSRRRQNRCRLQHLRHRNSEVAAAVLQLLPLLPLARFCSSKSEQMLRRHRRSSSLRLLLSLPAAMVRKATTCGSSCWARERKDSLKATTKLLVMGEEPDRSDCFQFSPRPERRHRSRLAAGAGPCGRGGALSHTQSPP